MNGLCSLVRLSALVWLAWLGLLGLLAALLAARVWHPHFLPVTATFAVMLGAGLALIVPGGWRLVHGPRRLRAPSCLLLGTAPLEFLAGHGLYALEAGYGRTFDDNLPVILLAPFGESLMDFEARFHYPVRTRGEKVVMISQVVPGADGQVAAMDRHSRAMEERLHRRIAGRIHSVRGPLLYMEGRAVSARRMPATPRFAETTQFTSAKSSFVLFAEVSLTTFRL
jgi:hypothetical protein